MHDAENEMLEKRSLMIKNDEGMNAKHEITTKNKI